jgi:hypothetical protein
MSYVMVTNITLSQSDYDALDLAIFESAYYDPNCTMTHYNDFTVVYLFNDCSSVWVNDVDRSIIVFFNSLRDMMFPVATTEGIVMQDKLHHIKFWREK